MTIFERPFSSIEELHETELEYLRMMFDSDNLIAVPAAVRYCAKYDLKHPQWLRSVINLASRESPKRRGRSSGIFARYKQDCIHYCRWSAVEEVREARKRLQGEIDVLSTLRGLKARQLQKQLEAKLADLGTSNEAAFECASEILARTPAACGAGMIKTSYDMVQRVIDEAEETGRNSAMRFHVLESGLVSNHSSGTKIKNRQGKKQASFRNSKA